MTTPRSRSRLDLSPVDRIRQTAVRTQGWGFGLCAVAALLWAWFAVMLLVPYTAGQNDRDCKARITSEHLHDNDFACVQERDWPELLGILALSVPFAVAGSTLYSRGSLTYRLAPLLARG
ncbi:hypothetical protein ACFY8W_23220 [Streptomyces sp. NPDC012637]|uniref:hypothetical protein n=1 Tax=Streptomyces sp. NPDC012637 TaxID=3364842 RepID=UPI0036E487C3